MLETVYAAWLDHHRPDKWVDLAEMLCPGCAETVSDELPTTQLPGEEPLPWSHRDGSPLCGQQGGAAGIGKTKTPPACVCAAAGGASGSHPRC